jgi:tetratricopeptide (TPR) repeat protein
VLSATALLSISPATFAQQVDQLIEQGDAHDERFQAGEALKYYLPAEKADPDNPNVLKKIARQYRHLMADAPSKDQKVKLGNTALEYSKKAAAVAPNDSDAQLSVGITLGKMLPLLPTREQVEASPRIRAAAERAIRLDPRNDLAYHILGRWHRVISEISPVKRALAPLIYGKLPTGSAEEAVRNLQKAVQINPNRLMHQIELGRAYAQLGNASNAKKHISRGLSMPNSDKDDPEIKALGRQTLAKLR